MAFAATKLRISSFISGDHSIASARTNAREGSSMASNASPEVRSSRGGSLIVNDDAADREESPISVDDKSEVDVPEVLTLLGQIYIAVQSLESHVRPRPQTSYRQKFKL